VTTARRAQDQSISFEHHGPSFYATTQPLEDPEFHVVDELAITHLERAEVGYEADCVTGSGVR